MTNKDLIRRELEQIKAANEGILQPETVVKFASDEATALHAQFTWDDGEAAHQYRLWQAREVIRVLVIVEERTSEPMRAYVSLMADRTLPGGGYRSLPAVMSDAEMRNQLLEQARAEFLAWRRRYEQLKKLEPIFAAADRVFQAKKAKTRPAIKAPT